MDCSIGRERHPHKAKLVSNRYHLPLRPLLYLPVEKKKRRKCFCFAIVLLFFPFRLARCVAKKVFFFFFFSCFIRQLFMVWDGKRGWVGGGFGTSRREPNRCVCVLLLFLFSFVAVVCALLFQLAWWMHYGGHQRERDSFMTTAGQLYVNRDTDAVG